MAGKFPKVNDLEKCLALVHGLRGDFCPTEEVKREEFLRVTESLRQLLNQYIGAVKAEQGNNISDLPSGSDASPVETEELEARAYATCVASPPYCVCCKDNPDCEWCMAYHDWLTQDETWRQEWRDQQK